MGHHCKNMQPKSVLITGGAGFIGSHVAEFYVRSGASVYIVDDMSTGRRSNLTSSADGVTVFVAKIEDFDFIQLGRIDAVIHLAAQAAVPISIKKFKESSTSNLLGMLNVFDYCRTMAIPCVYASSSAIYGNSSLGDDCVSSCLDVVTPYAVDKYAMENYAKILHGLYKISTIGLRFFNVYGPRQNPNSLYSGVISTFASNFLKNRKITIFGGYQTRDFVYISDVVRAIHRATEVVLNTSICDVVNILTGKETAIQGLVDMFESIVGERPVIEKCPLLEGDVTKSSGTTEKMEKLLKLCCGELTPLKTGLINTLEFIARES